MKKTSLFILMLVLAFTACQQRLYEKKDQKSITNAVVKEAAQTMEEFRKTSSLLLDDTRLAFLDKFQVYSDSMLHTNFKEYLTSSEEEAMKMEAAMPMLYFYREAFAKVLYEVKNTKVKHGTAQVWLLYNMGFVVKTPSGCFGIDIDHRLAERFEPYLDFLLVTHKHGDHYSMELIEAMNRKGKPVLSNFYKESPAYFSTSATDYKIGNFTIHTDISDHLLDPKLPDFVTLFRIDCGEDSGNFSLLHCGDSGFNPERFKNVEGPVGMAVIRWGAARENNIMGTGKGQITTDYAILSHLIEMRHRPYPHGQASITKTLEHLPNVKCKHTILPFWGEKLIWKDGKLQ